MMNLGKMIMMGLFLFLAGCGSVEVAHNQADASLDNKGRITQQNTWCNGRYGSGGRIAAYYEGSVSNYFPSGVNYTNVYDSARAQWSGISSNVAVNKTSSTLNTPDKYYVGTTATPFLFGRITTFYYDYYGNLVQSDPQNITSEDTNSNWVKTHVSLYDNQMNNYGLTTTQRVYVATHEIGHTLKLAHLDDTLTCTQTPLPSGERSVMQSGDGNVLNWGVQPYDKRELKAKWGL